jgi:hypothetical protein
MKFFTKFIKLVVLDTKRINRTWKINSDPMKPNLIKGLNLWQGFVTLKKCHQMKCDHQRSSEKNSPLGLSIHVIRYSLITDIA